MTPLSTRLDIIDSYKIPTHSYIAAISEIHNQEELFGDLTTDEYARRIVELSNGHGEDIEDPKLLKYTYKYLIQEYIRSFNGGTVNINTLYYFNFAVDLATKFIDNHSYVFTEVDEDTNTAKISKKTQAIKLWNDKKGEDLTRQQWLSLLQDTLGFSKSTASSYYSQLKSGKF
jgi:hypothetical protein